MAPEDTVCVASLKEFCRVGHLSSEDLETFNPNVQKQP